MRRRRKAWSRFSLMGSEANNTVDVLILDLQLLEL